MMTMVSLALSIILVMLAHHGHKRLPQIHVLERVKREKSTLNLESVTPSPTLF